MLLTFLTNLSTTGSSYFLYVSVHEYIIIMSVLLHAIEHIV